MTRLFEAKFGAPPHYWQLDVAEAMILGLDSLVIAGTGSGKTIPFILPLMLDTTKKGLVVSPLKVLQEDQICSILYEVHVLLPELLQEWQIWPYGSGGSTSE